MLRSKKHHTACDCDQEDSADDRKRKKTSHVTGPGSGAGKLVRPDRVSTFFVAAESDRGPFAGLGVWVRVELERFLELEVGSPKFPMAASACRDVGAAVRFRGKINPDLIRADDAKRVGFRHRTFLSDGRQRRLQIRRRNAVGRSVNGRITVSRASGDGPQKSDRDHSPRKCHKLDETDAADRPSPLRVASHWQKNRAP